MALPSGWANRITIARGVVAAALCVVLHLLATGDSHDGTLWTVAFVLFVVGAVTDVLDGYIARSRGEVSVFGRIADPFVDKILILGSGIFLISIPGIPAALPAWVVAAILAREMLVTALRGAVEGRGGNFQAAWWGKVKMIVQCVAIGAAMLYGARVAWVSAGVFGDLSFARLVAYVAAAVTIASGVDYTVRAYRLLSGGPTGA
jgi:CDP-diacylglycerol---glycerol-3-phosphate 3-phosphatidyltransferase